MTSIFFIYSNFAKKLIIFPKRNLHCKKPTLNLWCQSQKSNLFSTIMLVHHFQLLYQLFVWSIIILWPLPSRAHSADNNAEIWPALYAFWPACLLVCYHSLSGPSQVYSANQFYLSNKTSSWTSTFLGVLTLFEPDHLELIG